MAAPSTHEAGPFSGRWAGTHRLLIVDYHFISSPLPIKHPMGNAASRCEEAIADPRSSEVVSSKQAVDEAAQEAVVDTISGDGGCIAFGFAAREAG